MSYLFVQTIKNLAACSFVLFFIPVCGQKSVHDSLKIYYQDSLIVSKNFRDGTVSNQLTVKVINPCNTEKEKFDGVVTIISADLKSRNYSDRLVYNYPYAQSGLINLKTNNISYYTVNKHQAFFIPFTYCGNWDNDTKVSYIIFYNLKKYLYHIKYRCGEDDKCKPTDNLNMILKDLPLALQSKFIGDLETKYNHSNDFY